MDLSTYTNHGFDRGAPVWKEALWCVLGDPVVRSVFTPSGLKKAVLRWFGAKIGTGGRIKNDVRIKFPWKLVVGDHVWIGEHAWIDNLELVTIGSSACLSQGVYLCTGNHDWSDPLFRLRCLPITIGAKAWIGAMSRVGPGVAVGEGAVLTMAAAAFTRLEPWCVHQGNPAKKVRDRNIRTSGTGDDGHRRGE